MRQAALRYARDNQAVHRRQLEELLRIPSISTLPDHVNDVRRAGQWVADRLIAMGLSGVEVIPTDGHPMVVGEWIRATAGAPTVLLYGHYDVQPVDPVEQWLSPPFEPTCRGDNLFARGASDNKGQFLAALAAADSYLHAANGLPVNLKVLIEGEEELTSPNVATFLAKHRARLDCDAVLICDQTMIDVEHPVIMTGTRGLVYMEIEVRGPHTDLHSGMVGGAIDNPLNALVNILAKLHNDQRQITIPKFYDDVEVVDIAEREKINQAPITDAALLHLTGVPEVAGETGYTTVERMSIRPTLDLHGIVGGFTDTGKKTVIPAQVVAKLSCRLVPNQDPRRIAELLSEHVQKIAPRSVSVTTRTISTGWPSRIDVNCPAIVAADRAYRKGFGVPPVYVPGGGTLPIVTDLQSTFNVPVVMIGFGLPDDNMHAPNEKIYLPNFYRGIDTVIHYFAELAGIDDDATLS